MPADHDRGSAGDQRADEISEQGNMNLGLVTPTYERDLERCELLCESVDRHVTSFSRHYLIVLDEELPLFTKLNTARREVLPLSLLLPSWLKPLPRYMRRKHRRYWWSLRALPVSGWHVQQFVKINAVNLLSEARFCLLDSDVVFFRPLTCRNSPSPMRCRCCSARVRSRLTRLCMRRGSARPMVFSG